MRLACGKTARNIGFLLLPVLVAWLRLSVVGAVGLSLLSGLLIYFSFRFTLESPTMSGNTVPARYGGKRFLLEAMPVNHFGEKVRWCLDLLDIPYEEETNGGLLTYFILGRSVPSLFDRQSGSLIANSDNALQYLYGVYSATIPAASRLLQRTSVTISWENELNFFGHAIQRYCYAQFLAHGDVHNPRVCWGAFEPKVPALQRAAILYGYPVLMGALARALNLRNPKGVENARVLIQKMLSRVDAALAENEYLTGPSLSYVDITFCSLAAPLIPEHCALWAGGRFTSFHPKFDMYPATLLELSRDMQGRPCGKFIERVFKQYRTSKL